MFIKPLLLAFTIGMLAACGATPQPSHGADNTPNGVSVYGTIDLGVGKTSSSGTGQR